MALPRPTSQTDIQTGAPGTTVSHDVPKNDVPDRHPNLHPRHDVRTGAPLSDVLGDVLGVTVHPPYLRALADPARNAGLPSGLIDRAGWG